MKKWICALMATVMLLGVATACTGSGTPATTTAAASTGTTAAASTGTTAAASTDTTAAASGDVQKLIYGVVAEPQGFDPGNSGETYAIPVLVNCFVGLAKIGEDGTTQPACAESWDISDDGMTYTFHLRKDMKWSDGSVLNANDFVYSWRRIASPELASTSASSMFHIVGGEEYFNGEGKAEDMMAVAVDDYTFEVTLKYPLPYFLDLIRGYDMGPVHQASVEAGGDTWHRNADTYVTNGPFKVRAFEFGKQYVLEKNEHYYNAANVQLEEITFRIIGDNNTGMTAVETGEIDGYDKVPDAEVTRMKMESPAFHSKSMLSTTYYLVNVTKEPFNDPRVVWALAKALDRESIIKDVLLNVYEPAFGIAPLGMMVGDVDFRTAAGNYGLSANAQVEEAKQLLADAGYPNGEGFPTIRLRYYTNDSVKKVVEAMQQMWQENLNIKCEITNADWQVFFAEVLALDYDIGAMGMSGGVAHPASYLEEFVTGRTGNEMTGWSNARYDELLKLAVSSADEDKTLEYLIEAEGLLMADLSNIPIYHSSKTFLMQPYVQGWYCTNTNYIFYENAYISGK